MDESYPPRPFLCHCGKVLGEIYRTSNRIVLLRVYAKAQDDIIPVFDRLIFSVIGVYECKAVICTHCGADRSWSANQLALDDMILKLRSHRGIAGV